MGAWIEIFSERMQRDKRYASLPTWERGLKSSPQRQSMSQPSVAPYMGAWIEMFMLAAPDMYEASLPTWERGLKFMERVNDVSPLLSLPTWERGLKSVVIQWADWSKCVAPYMGAWIEILNMFPCLQSKTCRSLHGSVD